MTSKRRNRIGRRSSRPFAGVTKRRGMSAVAGLFVVAGAIGAAVWALLNRRSEEPVHPEGFADVEGKAGEQAEEQVGT